MGRGGVIGLFKGVDGSRRDRVFQWSKNPIYLSVSLSFLVDTGLTQDRKCFIWENILLGLEDEISRAYFSESQKTNLSTL